MSQEPKCNLFCHELSFFSYHTSSQGREKSSISSYLAYVGAAISLTAAKISIKQKRQENFSVRP